MLKTAENESEIIYKFYFLEMKITNQITDSTSWYQTFKNVGHQFSDVKNIEKMLRKVNTGWGRT